MVRPRILLIGPAGQVGHELARTLAGIGHVVPVGRPAIDLTNPDSIRGWVEFVAPDVVVNAAAYTAVDQAEDEAEICTTINVTAPTILAETVRRLGVLMVHFSTDYVFDGSGNRPYCEEDAMNPLGVYGRSKAMGDQAILASGARHLIFRVAWVYSTHRRNFFNTIRRLAAERDQLDVVNDQFGAPTWAGTIAAVATGAIERRLAGVGEDGLYHLATSGVTTWRVFAEEIVGRIGPVRCREVRSISSSQFPARATRPSFSVLSSAKLRTVFGLSIPYWRDSFNEMCRRDAVCQPPNENHETPDHRRSRIHRIEHHPACY